PVAPVSSLAAVAAQVPVTHEGEAVLVCNDARMGELYHAVFVCTPGEEEPRLLGAERVSPPGRIEVAEGVRHVAGNGLARHPELRTRLVAAGLQFHDGLFPRADAIARIGARLLRMGHGVAATEALPTYVRDDVARPGPGPVTRLS
ncbi:MAG TPA: hypothetical protein VMT50_04710, partial [Steroidobacteraceae bacterium]|nr:hypothetical protein [Steroidobacteraceae bacterium]